MPPPTGVIGPFDGNGVFLEQAQRLLGQPDVATVFLRRFFAGVDFHPVDLLLAAVGLRHCRVDHLDHHRRDVHADAVAFDEGNDRIVRHRLAGNDFLAVLGNLDQRTRAHCNSISSGETVVVRRKNSP
jgi:hypothetical protein